MLSFLRGTIKTKTDKFIILEVNNIGYKIFAPQNVLESSNAEGEPQELFIYHYVAEGREELYGFLTFKDLEFFELLLSVSGIGPKSALGIIAVASSEAIKKAIISEDTSIFIKVSGVGQKTAERVILELKNKLPKQGYILENEDLEAIEALTELGYPQREAREVLTRIPPNIILIGEKIRWALKHLGKK